MRPCGLSGPDNRSGLVGDLHAGGARSTAEGAARSVVAHPDRVSPTYLTFAPVLARIDRASHLSHTVTSRFHRSVIVCSNGGLFYRAQDGGGHVAFQHATLRCFGGVCRSAHAKDKASRVQNCQDVVRACVRRRQALDAAGVDPRDIDLIILGTDSPDYITPATSVVVQHKLGARCAGTYDVGCACASFPTAIAAAAGQLVTNTWMKYVLVIGAYMMSKLAADDDVTRFYYGDGAGAAVFSLTISTWPYSPKSAWRRSRWSWKTLGFLWRRPIGSWRTGAIPVPPAFPWR